MRNYIRKTSQNSWREDDMASAVKSVRDRRLTLQAAATEFSVPNATLFRRCRKENNTDEPNFDVDQIAVFTVPNKPCKVIRHKGKKQIGALSSAERINENIFPEETIVAIETTNKPMTSDAVSQHTDIPRNIISTVKPIASLSLVSQQQWNRHLEKNPAAKKDTTHAIRVTPEDILSIPQDEKEQGEECYSNFNSIHPGATNKGPTAIKL
ncbi:hypothetical protein PR048_013133 [Dryococelus australis]|uniref:HTH psq-type domain-containing protein n=1 Tax=Dryococelus australis TaxID=614101 RepID=A0ABQ9HRB6_9NEOP|nr:hypothetical protein PR048_013133 [Dryococelus australis]